MFKFKKTAEAEKPVKKPFQWPERFNLNRVQTPSRIGVDLGTTSIKMVELRESKGVEVAAVAAVSVPHGLITDQGIQDIDAVVLLIQNCWEKLNTNIKHVSIALPSALAITKVFKIQTSLSGKEKHEAAMREANTQLPFAIDEASWDWMPLSSSDGEFTDALLVAAVRDKVSERVGVVEAAGLIVDTVDIESLVIQHLLTHSAGNWGIDKNELVAVIDVGHYNLNFAVFKNNRPLWTRELAFQRQDIDHAWQSSMGLEDAEFRAARKEKTHDWVNAGLPYVERIADELVRGLESFPASGDEKITTILLCGGGALLPNLEESLAAASGQNVRVLKPFSAFYLPVKIADFTQELETVFTLATGLALRRFDPPTSIEDLV